MTGAALCTLNVPRVLQWLALAHWRPDAPLLLDTFCGAGGAAVGYWRAGFNVLGVDIAPQPHYPFPFVQMDAIEAIWLLGPYVDAIHASPPCQRFSKTYALPNVGNYPNLIPPTRQVIENVGKPYVIENVPGAPLIAPIKLSGPQFDLRVIRERWFEVSPWMLSPPPVRASGGTASHRGYSSFANGARYITVAGNNYRAEDGYRAMGIYWMTNRNELSESIPPAYTEYIGRHLMRVVRPEERTA
jgi:DNA (cytosine-5)-methyltransferase 1